MNRFLFSIGLIFLIISIGSLVALIQFSHTPMHIGGNIPLIQPVTCEGSQCNGGTGGGGITPPFLISQDTIDQGLIVEYEWPKQMDIDGSESISVALTVKRRGLPSDTLPPPPTGDVNDRGEQSLIPDSLTAEEYTNCQGDARTCLLSNMFGSGYTLSTASAYMIGTSFDVQLMGPVERATDQPFIEWDWNIFPKAIGSQVLTAGIDLQWTPTGKGGGMPILRQLWEGPIAIKVNQPFLDTGQLSLSSAISGAFGIGFTGVSIPWIWEQRQQKREQKKKKSKFCRDCGAENPEDFEYCMKCGKPRATLPNTTISTQAVPSSPRFTGESLTSVDNTAGAQQTPVPSFAQITSVGSTAGAQQTPVSGSAQKDGNA